MPMRHGGRLASRASTWPRDHFCRSTILPRRSWPTRWNEFLPISMPITAISLLSFSDMARSFVFGAPCQLGLLEGREHGRTIPFSDIGRIEIPQRTSLLPYRDVLSFRSKARETSGSEATRVHHAARQRGSRLADRGARAAGAACAARLHFRRHIGKHAGL